MSQSGNTRWDLQVRALQLEVAAHRDGDETPAARGLRAEAAELRRRALGERIYPVVICSECFRVTGWVDAAGECDDCLRRALLQAAYEDPHGGWVPLMPVQPVVQRSPRPPLHARLAAAVGWRNALDRAVWHSWRFRVEPDDTGPIDPEPDFEVEVAHREEVAAADGSGLIVRFNTATHRFIDGVWLQLAGTKIGSGDTLTPAEFSAGLPIDQLAEAWGDFVAEVAAFNREAWSRESQRREQAREAAIAREDALREQTGAIDLLDDTRT
jgi:hypothetical protein